MQLVILVRPLVPRNLASRIEHDQRRHLVNSERRHAFLTDFRFTSGEERHVAMEIRAERFEERLDEGGGGEQHCHWLLVFLLKVRSLSVTECQDK